jgi:UDP-glucose 4-epimerase
MNGKPKILITGGLGNLGSWLSEYFSYKYDVYVLSKNVNNLLNCKYKLIQADISSIKSLKVNLKIEFDYCIHAASYNEFFHENYYEKALEVNTLGTRNLIEVLKNTKIKNFIYLSTFHVYGSIDGLITETAKLRPKNDYASTHLFAEFYLRQFYYSHNFKSVILRLTNCYGAPKDINSTKWYLVLNDLVKSAFSNHEIKLKGNGKAVRDLIWMGDISSVIETCLNRVSSDVYNLSSGKTFQMMDLAIKVQSIYETRYHKEIEIITSKNDKTKFSELIVDNSKINKILNFKFNDRLNEEINSIFDLLEKNKHLA